MRGTRGRPNPGRIGGDVLVLVGIVLLVNASGGFVLDIGTPQYRYETIDISDPDDVVGNMTTRPATVDCIQNTVDELCGIESRQVASTGDPSTAVTIPIDRHPFIPQPVSEPRIATHDTSQNGWSNQLYERSIEPSEEGDAARHVLELDPVGPRAALRALSVNLSRLPADSPARELVTTGSIVRSEPVEFETNVVRTESGWSIVDRTDVDPGNDFLNTGWRLLQGVVGLGAVVRGRFTESALRRYLNRWQLWW